MPKPGERISDPQGRITPTWRNWLRTLSAADSLSDVWTAIQEIRQQLASQGVSSFLPFGTVVQGINSVTQYGTLDSGRVQLLLDGDEEAPAASHYYGTDAQGVRGYHVLPTSGVLPVVTGEIDNGQPVFVYADDGSLIYTEIA